MYVRVGIEADGKERTMSEEDQLPNFEETSLTDIWRYRQEFEEEEQHGKKRRGHADQAIYKLAVEADATILQTEAGPIEIAYSASYSYNSAVVDGAFFNLIKRDGLENEWNQFVSHSYKINKRWLERMKKRGPEYQEVIDKMINATQGGSRSLKGPSLEELGGYAPREAEEGVAI